MWLLLEDRPPVVTPSPQVVRKQPYHSTGLSTNPNPPTEAHPQTRCHSALDFTDLPVLAPLLNKSPVVRQELLAFKSHPASAQLIFVTDNNFWACRLFSSSEVPPSIPKHQRLLLKASQLGEATEVVARKYSTLNPSSLKAICITSLQAKQAADHQHPSHHSACVQGAQVPAL